MKDDAFTEEDGWETYKRIRVLSWEPWGFHEASMRKLGWCGPDPLGRKDSNFIVFDTDEGMYSDKTSNQIKLAVAMILTLTLGGYPTREQRTVYKVTKRMERGTRSSRF